MESDRTSHRSDREDRLTSSVSPPPPPPNVLAGARPSSFPAAARRAIRPRGVSSLPPGAAAQLRGVRGRADSVGAGVGHGGADLRHGVHVAPDVGMHSLCAGQLPDKPGAHEYDPGDHGPARLLLHDRAGQPEHSAEPRVRPFPGPVLVRRRRGHVWRHGRRLVAPLLPVHARVADADADALADGDGLGHADPVARGSEPEQHGDDHDDANANTLADGDGHGHADTVARGSEPEQLGYDHGNAVADALADGDDLGHADTDARGSEPEQHGHDHGDAVGHGHSHTHADANGDADGFCHVHGDADAIADAAHPARHIRLRPPHRWLSDSRCALRGHVYRAPVGRGRRRVWLRGLRGRGRVCNGHAARGISDDAADYRGYGGQAVVSWERRRRGGRRRRRLLSQWFPGLRRRRSERHPERRPGVAGRRHSGRRRRHGRV